MKICFVSPGVLYTSDRKFHQQGSESVILGISRCLSKKGHQVYITGRFKDFEDNEMYNEDINFINIKSPYLRDDKIYQIGSAILYSKGVSRELNKLDVDVLSLNERFSAFFPSKLNIPKTFTTHNPDAMDFYKSFAFKNNKLNYAFFGLKKKIEECVISNSDKIVILNRFIADYLKDRGFDNTTIIPNAVDVKKYFNREDDNFILYAGRLSNVKGISYLIKAFSKINKETDDFSLLIVGSGPEEFKLKSLVQKENIESKVQFCPMANKTKLREYLSRCSVFVLPSLFEMMPVTLLEGMASSKPVIASNIPGPADIITHSYNGLLFEKGNIAELSEYLKILIENKDLRDKLGRNARKTVEKWYTFKKVAERYEKLFSALVENRNVTQR
jgi:glycosyltransferase involved in cell wall biosynthesis